MLFELPSSWCFCYSGPDLRNHGNLLGLTLVGRGAGGLEATEVWLVTEVKPVSLGAHPQPAEPDPDSRGLAPELCGPVCLNRGGGGGGGLPAREKPFLTRLSG